MYSYIPQNTFASQKNIERKNKMLAILKGKQDIFFQSDMRVLILVVLFEMAMNI
jgi:hypothetical protein